MPAPSQNLKDYARKEFICLLATIEHGYGKGMAGLIAEAQLEAIAIHLRGSVGAEAAYNTLQRHADDVAGVLAQQAARQQ
jgi:hypothetical protein